MSLISDTTILHPANALRCEHTKLNSELGSRSHITGVMGMPRVFCMIIRASALTATGHSTDPAPEAHGPLDDQHLDLSFCLA